jgi:carboxyl-terminal processing protease
MTTYVTLKVQGKKEVGEAVDAFQTSSDLTYWLDNDTLSYLQEIVDSYYLGDAGEWDMEAALDDLYRSYVASLGDEYGVYYSPEEYQAMLEDLAGNYVGIGVQVVYDVETSSILVVSVLSDSAAEAAGIEAGDRIIAVGDTSVSELGLSGAVSLIQGEEGTPVTITIQRDEESSTLTLVRKSGISQSVYGSLCGDQATGLIRITEFDSTTPDQFNTVVENLLSQGASQFIFDLRNNPGGELSSVLSVLSRILPEETVLVRIVDADGNEEVRYSDSSETIDCPMAILINGNTASAAELFTSCLRDYQKATVVGTTSYGKGCMQTILKLPNGGAIKLTFRMYNPPISDNFHGIGITPDIVEDPNEAVETTSLFLLDEASDNQLQAALSSFHIPDNG